MIPINLLERADPGDQLVLDMSGIPAEEREQLLRGICDMSKLPRHTLKCEASRWRILPSGLLEYLGWTSSAEEYRRFPEFSHLPILTPYDLYRAEPPLGPAPGFSDLF